MAAISRAQELHQLLPGLNALFGEEYNNYENEHAEIYATENSERSFEEELKLSGVLLQMIFQNSQLHKFLRARSRSYYIPLQTGH